MKYSSYFDKRKNTFETSFELMRRNMKPSITYQIVELGTSRSFVSGGVEGCMRADIKYWHPESPELWDWGAGIFTKVFADNLEGTNFKLYTIDPSSDAVYIVNTMCDFNMDVEIVRDYSSNFLNTFTGKIDFLYMDHMESGEEACLQHLEDCKIIISRNLMSPDGIILIDDVGDNIMNTKGKYSIPFLLENGYKKVLHEYQVILVKDSL